jgi:hypothetical protein
MEDDTTEFVDYIPTAIRLAENRLFRELDIDFSTVLGPLTMTAGNQEVLKPTNHRVTHNIYASIGGERVRLIKKTEDFLYDYWPNIAVLGPPKYYADKDNSSWLVAPVPDLPYTIQVEGEVVPENLSLSNQENIFTELCPDLLFFSTLSEMCDWMRDDERKATWETKITMALTSANNEGRRSRRDDNTNVNNPTGGRNTKGL